MKNIQVGYQFMHLGQEFTVTTIGETGFSAKSGETWEVVLPLAVKDDLEWTNPAPFVRWFPKTGDKLFYITLMGNESHVQSYVYHGEVDVQSLHALGNVFPTAEDAKAALEFVKQGLADYWMKTHDVDINREQKKAQVTL